MKRIPLLDGWRAVAILLVIIHHIGQGFYPTEDAYAVSITRFGAFGVDIFFGLSGLLITNLLLEEFEKEGQFHLRQFYVRRAFRILPPCFAFLAVYAALGFWTSGLELAGSAFFFRNYVPSNLASFGTGHLWSLAVEEHFYLVWPGLLFLFGPRKSKNVAAGLALSFGLWRIVESQWPAPLFPDVPQHYRSDLRMDALLWGCVSAFILDSAKERLKFQKQMRWPVWIGTVGVLCLAIRYYSILSSLIVAVLIPLVLAATLVHPEWRFTRLLGWAPLAWIGRISYSLYLWQQLFLAPGWEDAPEPWRHLPWNLALSFAAAIASYYLVEQPLIGLGRKIAAGLKKSDQANAHALVQSTEAV